MPNSDTSGGSTNPSGSNDPQAAVKSAVDSAKGAVDDASGAIGDAASSARDAVSGLAGEAQSIAADAGDKARSFVEENKGRAAEQISGITSAIGKAADELEARGQSQFATYTRNLVSGLDGLSRDLDQKGVDELIGSVGQFARSQPAAFLGAAALLGFVSSRFAMSTAKAAPGAGASQAAGMARGADSSDDAPFLANGPAAEANAYRGAR